MKKTILNLSIIFAMLALSACTQKPETLVTDGYSQAEMDAAIDKARSEVDLFLVELPKGDADSYSVKAPIVDGDNVEHFWLTDVSYKDGYFTGLIDNEPGMISNIRNGQEWKIKKDVISDWMFVRGDKIYGGYTIDPLLHAIPVEEADALRAKRVR